MQLHPHQGAPKVGCGLGRVSSGMKGMGREQGKDPDFFLLLVLRSHPGGDLSFLLVLSSEIPLLAVNVGCPVQAL